MVSPLLCCVPTKETVPHASTHPDIYEYGNILPGVTLGYPIQGGRGVQVEILLVDAVMPLWFESDLTYTVLPMTLNRNYPQYHCILLFLL